MEIQSWRMCSKLFFLLHGGYEVLQITGGGYESLRISGIHIDNIDQILFRYPQYMKNTSI